jgi:hypothetical protein
MQGFWGGLFLPGSADQTEEDVGYRANRSIAVQIPDRFRLQ